MTTATPESASTPTPRPANIGILTISDRASQGIYEDLGGPAIADCFNDYLTSAWQQIYRVIPDEQNIIEENLRDMAHNEHCDIIVTTGGTGPSPRDITPEATEAVCEKMMPGFGELMRQESLKYVPTAILSRQTAGTLGACLIVNLPGKPRAIRQCLDAVFPAIPYCLDLIGASYLEHNPDVITIFRPKK